MLAIKTLLGTLIVLLPMAKIIAYILFVFVALYIISLPNFNTNK